MYCSELTLLSSRAAPFYSIKFTIKCNCFAPLFMSLCQITQIKLDEDRRGKFHFFAKIKTESVKKKTTKFVE